MPLPCSTIPPKTATHMADRETEAEPLLPVVLHSLQAEGVAFLEDGLQVLKTQPAVAAVPSPVAAVSPELNHRAA